MNSIELAGVDPRRWDEARRRARVLQEWVSKPRHSKAECEAAAGSLGLTPKHFMTLVSAWKKHGDIARIGALGMRRGAERGRRTLPAATRAAVLEAIEELGPDARFVDVEADARRRCEVASTRPASSGMVHHLLMQARRNPDTRGGDAEILVGAVACVLPTLDAEGEVAAPTLVAGVLMPETFVAAHRLVTPGGDAEVAVRDVLADLTGGKARRPIILAKRLAGHLHITEGAMRADRQVTVGTQAEILAKPLGSHLGTIPIRHRWRHDGGLDLPPDDASISRPLTPEDARKAIAIAIAAHNAARVPADVRAAGPA